MPRLYTPHSKHTGPGGARGIKGSPMDLSDADAHSLLNDPSHCFEEPGKRQFIATKNGKLYVYQDDNAGGFHGYRISGNECAAKYPKAAAKIAELLKIDFKRLQKLS
jgi:filamentous hemagglutinin